MTGNFDDELRNRLNALNADVSGVPMAGAHAARHRAAQRTRNQITGGVLAGVAALAIGVVGVTQENLFSAPDPVAPTDTQTPTMMPSPTQDPDDTDGPVPPDGSTIPDDAFLITEDITPELEPGDVFPEWVEGDATEVPFDCAPAVPEGAAYRYFSNEQNGHFLQFIEATADPVGRFSQLRADLESCVRAFEEEAGDTDQPHTQMSQAWAVDGVGDEAWMAHYWSLLDEPIDFAPSNLVAVRLMRTGDYVSMVIDGGPGQDDNMNMATERLELSAQRLCTALGIECVGEVEARRLIPEPAGEISGWLTVEDVASIPGYESISEGSEPIDPNSSDAGVDQPGWPLADLVLNPVDSGATSLLTRAYVPMEPTEPALLHQSVAWFPDEARAQAHYDELVAAIPDAYGRDAEVTDTGSADRDGYSFATWRSENADIDETRVVGVVVSGDAVSVVSTGFFGFEDRDLTPEQLTDLMIRAAERLR